MIKVLEIEQSFQGFKVGHQIGDSSGVGFSVFRQGRAFNFDDNELESTKIGFGFGISLNDIEIGLGRATRQTTRSFPYAGSIVVDDTEIQEETVSLKWTF